jgi:hypothetical protein
MFALAYKREGVIAAASLPSLVCATSRFPRSRCESIVTNSTSISGWVTESLCRPGRRMLKPVNEVSAAPRAGRRIIFVAMARTARYTVAYDCDGRTVDLCRIIFGGDGSYYVTAPYHPLDRALAGIYTVNYARENVIALSDAVELGVLDDDERRLKIAHHPDGFLQFSGEGIRSGRDASGHPRGIGLMSWPLRNPTFGPSFSLLFSDPLECGRKAEPGGAHVTFKESDLHHLRKNMAGLRITGFYLPARWREFVYRATDGSYWLHLLHPNGQALKRLRVVLAAVDAEYSGLLGLEALPHSLEGVGTGPQFILSTSTGNLRRNQDGDLLGDQLLCFYPQPDFSSASVPSLNYTLPSPSPSAPPGTTSIEPEPQT